MIAVLFALPALAQDLEMPIASPHATVSQQIGTTEVTVDYYSPGKKDREIFGDLVPYGEMWRLGANSGTTLTTTSALTIGGVAIEPGTYIVFAKPGAESWQVVLNSDLKARPWKFDEKRNVASFEVAPEEGPGRERMTFLFSDTTDRSSTLNLEWAGVRVPVPLEVDTAGLVNASIDDYVGRASRRLADAARFRGENGDIDGALALVEKALGVEQTWYATFVKAELLKEKGEAKLAYKAAKEAMSLGEGKDGFFWKDRVEKALAEWPKK